jgi:hypothetical protein
VCPAYTSLKQATQLSNLSGGTTLMKLSYCGLMLRRSEVAEALTTGIRSGDMRLVTDTVVGLLVQQMSPTCPHTFCNRNYTCNSHIRQMLSLGLYGKSSGSSQCIHITYLHTIHRILGQSARLEPGLSSFLQIPMKS